MKTIAHLVLVASLSACASQYGYDGDDAAIIKFSGNTKYFFVEAYENTDCDKSAYGDRFATFSGPIANVTDPGKGLSVAVPAGKEIVFTARYIDAQPAVNRTCNVTVGFSPKPGKNYEAFFRVDEAVTECSYSISTFDSNGEEIEETTAFVSNNLCLEGKNQGPVNAQAGRIHWDVKICDNFGNCR